MPQYCLVKHHIVNSVVDGPDLGNDPDTLPVSGDVTFYPILGHGDSVVVTAGSEKVTYILSPISARIVNGKISVNGEEGVKLFAGGPNSNPDRIRYRAKFTGLNIAGSKRIDLKDVLFEAVPGGELTLSMAQPVPGAPYPGYSATIERGIAQIKGARDEALGQVEGAVDEAITGSGGETIRKIAGQRDTITDVPETAWAHATEDGHRLPLGYNTSGGLDEHAKTVFSESLGVPEKADQDAVDAALSQKQDSIDVDNPDYQWAMINLRSQLLMGIRNDGALIAPKHRLAPPREYAKRVDGTWGPVFADTTTMTIWGSSTPAGLGSYIADAFTDAPVTVNNMAQGGEWAQHSAARMGAIRGVVEPVTIPESGSVPLTFVDFAPRTADYAMRPFTATIGGVRGLVDTTSNDTKFVRSVSGDAVTLTEQTEVIPIDGPQTREHVTLFGVGKNNLTQRSNIDLVMDHVDTMVNYLTPKYPRFLIIGHHHNTGLAGDDNFARPHVDQVNAYSRDTYGPLYFDTIGVYTDLDRWAAAGITPTQADLDDMALGNKPPSLAQDSSHFNPAGYRMLATALREHMADLGWY